jgi:hypothetical protein
MNARTLGRAVAALTLVALVAGGCTPDPTPSPPLTPTPTLSATPTESDQEREQRLAYEAAEKSYRTFRAEYRRVLRQGGAKEPTAVMKDTAGGPYLDTFAKIAQGYKIVGDHQRGREIIQYVRHGGYSTESLSLNVCEDGRPVQVIRKNGKQGGVGEVRTATLEVRYVGSTWKVWSGTGEMVKACE